MNRYRNTVERFHSLDALRGIAALSIVFWHWQHFFFTGTTPGTVDLARLPLHEWLFPLYTKGWLAVDLFFTISGFIFYWLYSKSVSEGEISAGKFALLRFSRLYPLHFATLLIVAASQIWLMSARGSNFVYPNNDVKHFLLNLFFASSWGMENSSSFNGPTWSVSVEVLLYALFFVCCRLFPIRASVLVIISMTGFTIVWDYFPPVGRGIGLFFMGGCVFLAHQAIIESRRAADITKWAGYLMLATWVATIATLYGFDQSLLSLRSAPLYWHIDTPAQRGLPALHSAWPILVLFPITILSLSLFDSRRGSLGKRVSFLGDISYSSYLIHFPLQLLFSAVVAWFGVSNSVFYSSWFMLLFFSVLIGICLVSFRYFEMPTQRLLRQQGSQPSGSPPID